MTELELIELRHTLQNFSFAWQWAHYNSLLRDANKFYSIVPKAHKINWNKEAIKEQHELEDSQTITNLCMYQLRDNRYVWVLGRRKVK